MKERRGRGFLIEVEWVVGTAGVSYAAFARWRKAAGYASIRGEDRKHYVSWEAASAYLGGNGTPRVAEPPAGWKTVKQIAAETGIPERWLRRGAGRRVTPAVLVKNVLYVEPRGLIAWARARVPDPLPAGWEPVGGIAKEIGIAPRAVRAFVHRVGAEYRYTRLPPKPQIQMIVPANVARRIRLTLGKRPVGPGEETLTGFAARRLGGKMARSFYHYVMNVSSVTTFLRRGKGNRVVRAARVEDLEKELGVFREWAKTNARRSPIRLRHAGGGRGAPDSEAGEGTGRARVPYDRGQILEEDPGGPGEADGGHRVSYGHHRSAGGARHRGDSP